MTKDDAPDMLFGYPVVPVDNLEIWPYGWPDSKTEIVVDDWGEGVPVCEEQKRRWLVWWNRELDELSGMNGECVGDR